MDKEIFDYWFNELEHNCSGVDDWATNEINKRFGLNLTQSEASNIIRTQLNY